MGKHRELQERIRFGLSQLSARNAHHEFEHICRHVARQRICSNILPATGPVSSGGDQGRDFETFRTYLAGNVRGASTFAAAASDKALAFACTLQATQLRKKFRGDVTAIAKGPPVDAIHVFCTADVPVATRHDLQEWAQETFKLALEIYDGAAISEMLADQDLFWVANEYLSIPADAFPRGEDEGDSYASTRKRWSEAGNRQLTWAGYQEAKQAVRTLIDHADRRADIALWLESLAAFRDGVDPRLADQARYETAVMSLRIKGTMAGTEADAATYAEHTLASSSPEALLDLATLLMYGVGSLRDNASAFTAESLVTLLDRLRRRLDELIANTRDPHVQCALHDADAFAKMIPAPDATVAPDPAPAIQAWSRLLDIVPKAPLFPLEEFSQRLAAFVPFLVDAPGYENLTDRTDRLLAQRTGRFAAARNCANRARELSRAGRPLLAIRELNRAKVDWFAAETLPLALGSMLLASRHYLNLDLIYAAKYYAMAAAYLALGSSDPRVKNLVVPALALAADCDYKAGSWLQAAQLLRLVQVAHDSFSTEDFADDDEDFQRVLLYGGYIYAMGLRQPEPVRSQVEKVTADWPILDSLKEARQVAETAFFAAATEPRKAFFGVPFSDCRNQRGFAWSALGLLWRVRWKNDLVTSLAAEQFIAVAQIVIADLARTDAYIVPAEVEVEFTVDPARQHVHVERMPDNDKSAWEIAVPGEEAPLRDRHMQDVAAVIMLLEENSLRPDEWPIAKRLVESGLFEHTMVGHLYTTVCKEVTAPTEPPSIEDTDTALAVLPTRTETNVALEWNRELVEEYDPREIQKMLERRYRVGFEASRLTMPRLLDHPEGLSALDSLRAEGWLDWQILVAVGSLSATWRLEAEGMRADSADAREWSRRYAAKREEENWLPPPLSVFTHEALNRQLHVNLTSTIRNMKLELRQRTPVFSALKEFVRVKLRYFQDDIEHANILTPSSYGAGHDG